MVVIILQYIKHQINMLYTLNLHNVIRQTYLIKVGKNKHKSVFKKKIKKISSQNILSKSIAKAKEKVFMKYQHNILYGLK